MRETRMSAQSEKLVTDVKVLVKDTEALVKATASQAGEKIAELRKRAEDAVANLQPQLAKIESKVVETAKHTATTTNNYVHDRPWSAVGIAGCLGLVIGLLIGRR